MTRWSVRQDEYLREHCNEGAEAIAAAMRHRFGVSRSPEAVRRHAYRIGVPMVRYEVCVGCGGKARYLDAEGMCRACHQRRVTDAYRMRKRRLQEEFDMARRDFEDARRESDRLRQQARRERRRGYGESV